VFCLGSDVDLLLPACRVRQKHLSKIRVPVFSGYVTMYNRRYHRSGYVFYNPVKSTLCNEDEYLLKLLGYINLNPVAGKHAEWP
jgi:hypothetical protein